MSGYTAAPKEMGWDDEIEDNSTFTVLPAGDYKFQVRQFERARHMGSAKIPACNKAILTLSIENGTANGTVQTNFLLHEKVQWKIHEFFRCIGEKPDANGKIRMNWGRVQGASGTCKVGVRKWDSNGKEYEGNEVLKFYKPEEAPYIQDFTPLPADTDNPWGGGF